MLVGPTTPDGLPHGIRRRSVAAWLALPFGAGATSPLTVGPGGRFARVSDALRHARDGDTVLVAAGEYRGDVGVVERRGIVVRGLGAGAVLHADGRHAEGKAILVVRGDALIENLAFRGARVPDGNGAGIRLERGHLVLRRCRFHDNEMGLLSANDASMALGVVDCEFADAPRHDGPLHHLLYVGAIGSLAVSGSRFANGWRGHLLKSRARHSDVRGNSLVDGDGGEASYEIDFPNGGHNVVVGNLIAQSARTQNATLVSMGAEGGGGGSLLMAHNTLIDGGVREARFVHVWRDRLGGTVPITMVNNVFAGPGRLEPAGEEDGAGNRHVEAGALRDGRLLDGPAPQPLPNWASPLLEFTPPVGSRVVAEPRLAGALQPAR